MQSERCIHRLSSVVHRKPGVFRLVDSPHGAAVEIPAHGLHVGDNLPQLRRDRLVGWPLALRLRLHLPWACASSLSCLCIDPSHGAMLRLRCHGETARTMRLTPRCIDIFKLLLGAGWLTTSQIHRRFFAHATMDAARKRLRKLTEDEYLIMIQEHPMTEALFALGRAGKQSLERSGSSEIRLLRKLPKQLEHFIGINDLRIAAELSVPLRYFFASWELPGTGWRYPLIPDAVFAMQDRTFAAEFDRGLETIGYLMRTKITVYRRSFEGFPISRVLIITDRVTRMESLAKAVAREGGPFLFSTIDFVKEHGLNAPIFLEHLNGKAVPLV